MSINTKKVLRTIFFAVVIVVIGVMINASNVQAASKPAKVKGVKLDNIKYNSISVSWNKVKDATGYQVYVKYEKDNKKLTKEYKTKAVSYKITGLSQLTDYSIYVRAYITQKNKKVVYGSYSSKKVGTTTIKVYKPSYLFGGAYSTKKEHYNYVYWGVAKNATKYIIYKSTNYGAYKKIATTKKTLYNDYKIENKVYYKYKVVAVNDTVESSSIYTNSIMGCTEYYKYQNKSTQLVKAKKNSSYLYPFTEWRNISSEFAETQFHGKDSPHNGCDIGAPVGTPIMAVTDGEVVISDYNYARGNQVVLKHTNDKFWTRYQHMSVCYVKEGDKVKKGQVVGLVGNTGYSFGSHLHLEIGLNEDYQSLSSYAVGGSLLDVSMFLPNSKEKVELMKKGKYTQNKYFDDNGNLSSSKKNLANIKKALINKQNELNKY